MTQGKKKKRAANRSIMLAKKIIIKDGGTVSVGSAPQGGPGAGPASAFAGPGSTQLDPRSPRPVAASRGPAASAHVHPAAGRRRRPLGSSARPSAALGEAGQP